MFSGRKQMLAFGSVVVHCIIWLSCVIYSDSVILLQRCLHFKYDIHSEVFVMSLKTQVSGISDCDRWKLLINSFY